MLVPEKGDHEQGIADLNESLRLDPNNAWAYSARGGVWYAKCDYAKSIADCDQALRLDPTNAWARDLRAKAWQEQCRLEYINSIFERVRG